MWSENNAIDPLQMSRPVETGVLFCLLRLHDIFGAKRRKAPPPPEFAKVVPVQTADVPKVKAWIFRWNWTLDGLSFQSPIVVDYEYDMNMLKVQVKGLLEAKLKPYSILCCCSSIMLLFNFLIIRHDHVCILPTLQYCTSPYFIS